MNLDMAGVHFGPAVASLITEAKRLYSCQRHSHMEVLVPRKPVRMADVAERAGVSIATVSHVLSGRRPVAEHTRLRVQQVIDDLGFQPNAIARSMVTQRTHTIALIVPDITNPFYPAIARGLQDVLTPVDYFALLASTGGDSATERHLVELMVARQVDGIAFAGYYKHVHDVEPALAAGIPVVLLGSRTPRVGIDTVTSDNVGAAALATQHLLEQGHRRIGFISGPAGLGPVADRVLGYQEVLKENGVPVPTELMVRTQFTREGGREGMARLLELAARPEAVICTNDIVAIGAMDAARQAALRVPHDVAIVGFDDIDAASLVSPALTTVRIPAREEGAASGRLLLHRLTENAQPPQSVMFSGTLIRRESA